MLAVTASRLHAGFLSGSRGLASPPKVTWRLLETAEGLRESGSAAREEVAGKIQRSGPYYLGRACLWKSDLSDAGGLRPHLPRSLGHGAVSIPLPAGLR